MDTLSFLESYNYQPISFHYYLSALFGLVRDCQVPEGADRFEIVGIQLCHSAAYIKGRHDVAQFILCDIGKLMDQELNNKLMQFLKSENMANDGLLKFSHLQNLRIVFNELKDEFRSKRINESGYLGFITHAIMTLMEVPVSKMRPADYAKELRKILRQSIIAKPKERDNNSDVL